MSKPFPMFSSACSAGLLGVVVIAVVFSSLTFSAIGPQNVLILCNNSSPTSIYIAKMYRQYYPQIQDWQILMLTGLADCSGASATSATEIITRQQYNDLIAQPVRAYISDTAHPERFGQIMVLITTAGLPYRINDTTYTDAVTPAGSNADTIINQESSIDAASVESELTCLWYCDNGSAGFDKRNRMVNPYQGYRGCGSGISEFPRQQPGSKTMNWTIGISQLAPLVENPQMEGVIIPPKWPDFQLNYGTCNRVFNAGDMYLVCRLDGPKTQGQSAVFAVRNMLERSKLASNPAFGVNPAQAVAVLDDAPSLPQSKNYDNNRTYNLNYNCNFLNYNPAGANPPDAPKCRVKEDYIEAYRQMTLTDPDETLNIGSFYFAYNLAAILDRRGSVSLTQADLDALTISNPSRSAQQAIILLATFGRNGDENRSPGYLFLGPQGSSLFNCTNGAVFTSLESFNAVTMFSDLQTPANQGKIIDFLAIGGTAAIGHSFEPQPDAAIDNEFLFYNLLADEDGDGLADMTFAEAAWTAIPYLSWSEVPIGDPLMRIAYGTGGLAWQPMPGDVNNDNRVNYYDIWIIKGCLWGVLDLTNESYFNKYNDLCDINKDGRITNNDVLTAKSLLGTAR